MLPWTEAFPVVIVAPSVLVGCVLLRNGAVTLVIVGGGEDTPTVLEVVGSDAVERKTQNSTYMYKNTTHKTQKYESDKHALDYTTTKFFSLLQSLCTSL